MKEFLVNSSLFLIILFSYSCSSTEKKVPTDVDELSSNILLIRDTIQIDINDSTINSSSLNYFADDKDGLFIYSEEIFKDFYKIFFYSLTDSSKNFSIKLMTEGPQGVGKLFFPIQ